MKVPGKTKILWAAISCCLLTFIPACGGMSASAVEKKVRSDPQALKLHLSQYLSMPLENVNLDEVKVETVYRTAAALPAQWRHPNIHFDTLEELAKSKGEKISFAVVKVRGTCTGRQWGDDLQKSQNFEGSVLYAISKNMSPMPLLPEWRQ